MLRISVFLFVLLAGAAGASEAQERRGSDRGGDPGPVHMLLQMRTELELTPRQVYRLEAIEAEMNRLNQPLLARMSEIRGRIRGLGDPDLLTDERRRLFESYVAEARPVMEQIRENNWAAMRRVGEVLTDQQKEKMSKLLRQNSDTDRERSGNIPRLPGRRN